MSHSSITDQLSDLALSSSVSGPITKLPPELILRIIELAVAWGSVSNLKERIAVLRQTSLVCKDWVAPSQLLLLRQVYIDLDGPRLRSLLAAIDRKERWLCDRLVISGGSLAKAVDLIKRAESIETLKILHLVARGSWAELFSLSCVQKVTELNLDGVFDVLAGAERATALPSLRKLHLNLTDSAFTFPPSPVDSAGARALIAASANTITQLGLSFALPEHITALLSILEEIELPELKTLGISEKGAILYSKASSIVNACPAIKTLALASDERAFHDQILRGLNPAISLNRLTLNLHASLVGSTLDLTRWLALPALDELKALHIKGKDPNRWRYRGTGEAFVRAARRRPGMEMVTVGWD